MVSKEVLVPPSGGVPEAKSQEQKKGMTRREFLRKAAVVGGAVVAGTLIGGPPIVEATQKFFFPARAGSSPESVQKLRAVLGEYPSFPPPAEWTETLQLQAPNKEQVSVIKPETLSEKYGITFVAAKPAEDGKSLEKDDSLKIFVRPEEETFYRVFGFLYNTPDPHIIRNAIEVVAVEKLFICNLNITNPLMLSLADQDMSVFEDLKTWAKGRLTAFTEIYKHYRFPLPKVFIPDAHVFKYNLGRDLSPDTNLARLQDQLELADHIPEIGMAVCLTETPGGFDGAIVPEFITDKNGEPVVASDSIPMMRLRARIYVAGAMGHLTPRQDAIAATNFSEFVAHEVAHTEKSLTSTSVAPASEEDEEREHDEIYAVGRQYVALAEERIKKGDSSGFLFIVQTPQDTVLS